MTIIYLGEYNTKCYGVTYENNQKIKVQKFEDISADENKIHYVKALEVFIGKSEIRGLTIFSGALDRLVHQICI